MRESPGSNKAAGDHFDELELNTHPALRPMQVTDEPRPALRALAEPARHLWSGVDEDELMESPRVFIGSVDQLERKCVELRDRFGISYVMVSDGMEEFAPVVEHLAGR